MLCLYEIHNTQKVPSSCLSPLSVQRFLKIGDKMPIMPILTIVVKSSIEKSLTTLKKLFRTPAFLELELRNLAWIDSIHTYEKSIKKFW